MSERWQRPWYLLIPGVIAIALLLLPLVALALQVPWTSFFSIIATPEVLDALWLSIVTSLCATALVIVIGIPLAWLLAKDALPGTPAVRALVLVPLLMPPVVSGVALLAAFGHDGLVGSGLNLAFGVQIPLSTLGVVLAEAFVALPFLVITMEGAIRNLDRDYEEAARTNGASTWFTLRRVTLPILAPSLIAGTALVWARALGEYGATMTFAGNVPGVTQTLPLVVYAALKSNKDAAIAMSVLMLIVAIATVVALRKYFLPISLR